MYQVYTIIIHTQIQSSHELINFTHTLNPPTRCLVTVRRTNPSRAGVVVHKLFRVGWARCGCFGCGRCVFLRFFSCSNFRTKNRGHKKGIPVVGKRLLEVQRKQLISTCFVSDLQQHGKVGSYQEKQTVPPANPCARDTLTTTSIFCLFVLYFTEAITLCDEGPRWLLLNQRGVTVVALGESLRLMAAERPH